MSRTLLTKIIIGLFVLHVLAYYFFVYQVYPDGKLSKDHQATIDSLRDQHIDYLVMGDSHSGDSFDLNLYPDNFERIISGNEKYTQTYYRLKFILNELNTTIDNVVLPYDLHSFGERIPEKLQNDYYWVNVMGFQDYLELGIKSESTLEYVGKYTLGKAFPYAFNKPVILQWLNQEQRAARIEPALATLDPEIQEKRAFTRVNRMVMSGSKSIDPEMREYFLRILELTRDNDIDVILVKYPVSDLYLRQAAKKLEISEYYRELFELHKDMDHVTIIDTQKKFAKRRELFKDPDHLNDNGAIQFANFILDKEQFQGKKN